MCITLFEPWLSVLVTKWLENGGEKAIGYIIRFQSKLPEFLIVGDGEDYLSLVWMNIIT